MKTSLCPIPFKKLVGVFKVFGVGWFLVFTTLFLTMFFTGLIGDVGTLVGFLVAFLLPILPALIYGFLYKRKSDSYAIATSDRLLIVDSNEKCWREISYHSIRAIDVEEIETLSQRNNTTIKFTYICIHTNDPEDSSYVEYKHLLRKKYNMFPILYQEEFYTDLLTKFDLYRDVK